MPSPNVVPVHAVVDWNVDQVTALRDVFPASKKFHLLYGGSGSGKTLLIMYIIITRAMSVPNSRHGIFRYTRKDADDKLFSKSLIEALNLWPGLIASKNVVLKSGDLAVEFANGSKIVFGGLDENRQDGILGDEYQSIWINECNQPGITYKQVSHLVSRLRSPPKLANGRPMPMKMYFDCNPQWKSDWEYRAFIQGINPVEGTALENADQWTASELRPLSNVAVLGEGYIETMAAAMTAADRRRFIDGRWSEDNPGALFTDDCFNTTRLPYPHRVPSEPDRESSEAMIAWLAAQDIILDQVSISADPAVTNDPKSDLHGITVQGRTRELDETDGTWKDHVYVLADYSRQGSPDAICQLIAKAYTAWGASRLVMEKNQGGLWLESTMRKHHAGVNLRFVSANATTGGKNSRAEPVAGMYELGRVHHVGKLPKLEEQMCDWGSPNSRKKSPDRMDALVWGVTDLLDLQGRQEEEPGRAGMARQWFW